MIKGEWQCDNFFLHSIDDRKIVRVLMYFDDPEFMHLGDHLFFEPLANELNKQGFEVVISPTNIMSPYFSSLGYQTQKSNNILLSSFDLIITKFEFSDILKNANTNCLYISTSYTKSKDFLCDDIINKTAKILNFKRENSYAVPGSPISGNSKISIPPEHKYIVFNNYVDSASYRLGKNSYKKLYQYAVELAKKENLKIIHIGTESEKQRDRKKYKDVYLDLRGNTSMMDVFCLASHSNIKYCVSFDVFVAHVFFINKKKSYVKFRGRFSKTNTEYIINNVLPPFKSPLLKNDLVEFIE